MAVLTHSRLETTPVGTANLAGIINGNWSQLEAIFDPATTSGNAVFNAVVKAFLRSATLPTDAASLEWDASASKFIARPGLAALTTGATITADAKGAKLQTCTLSADTTIAVSNLAAGRQFDLLLTCDATTRALTWPASAINATGAALPASLTSGQILLVSFAATTGAASGLYITRATVT